VLCLGVAMFRGFPKPHSGLFTVLQDSVAAGVGCADKELRPLMERYATLLRKHPVFADLFGTI